MGIRERHGREREAVSRAILDAARTLFVAEGYHNVSLRKIAGRIEYSPAAIYSYFSSKDDIFYALAEEGFQLLARPPIGGETADPLEAVRRSFWRFYEFSKEYPEHFALMFADRSVPRIRDLERFGFVRDMQSRINQRIQRCIDLGVFPGGVHAAAAFHVLTASTLGAAMVRLCGRCAPDQADALTRDTIEVALAGLRAGVTLTGQGPRWLCADSDAPLTGTDKSQEAHRRRETDEQEDQAS